MTNMTATIEKIRSDFPIFQKHPDLNYFDTAATALKPQVVLDVVHGYDAEYSANIHRALYDISQEASDHYENARKTVAKFIGAKSADEVIFTSGTTASINHFSESFAKAFLKAGDRILITQMEHHANFLPWQRIAEDFKCELDVLPILPNGELDLAQLDHYLSQPNLKLLAITAVSNTLGTVNPVDMIAKKCKEKGIFVFVDAAQSVSHHQYHLAESDIDFLAFSGHKIFAPTGIGVLWGRKELLKKMPPFFVGGGMVYEASIDKSIFLTPPARFEAGTPPIAQAIGLARAIEYLQALGWDTIHEIEKEHLRRGNEVFAKYKDFIKVYGSSEHKIPIFSFSVNEIHTHDVGSFLNEMKLCVRTGHQCTQPLWKFFGVSSVTRISMSVYNHFEEWEKIDQGLKMLLEFFDVRKFS
ncbi:MAG: aminotransferase class V-fold PLP-dependent enzyme [Brevinema sp.]